METYLLKFSACLVIFWLIYVLFLERQNMHHLKRFYLLGAVVLALTIPLLTITYYVEPIVTDFNISQTFIPIEPSYTAVIEERPSFWSLENVLWLIYGLGVLLFLTRFTINLVKMNIRISGNKRIKKHPFIYVLLKELRIPHSFFNYVFLNTSKYEADAIPKEVILHEETHAKQLHSIDIIAIELLQIVFWFHPLIYILKHHIKLNHEFLADQAVLEEGIDTKTYQNILLQFSSPDSNRDTQDYQLSSAINYSSIKKRFTVMKTQTSKTRIWLSSLLLLPIIAILFYSFAEREYVEKVSIETSDVLQVENEALGEGATEAMMKEYNDWIKKLNNKSLGLFIPVGTWERLVAIYDLMSEEQRNSVETHSYLQEIITPNLYSVKPSIPTTAQFESWKNEKEFAIWIDNKHISNSELNNYKVSDIAHYAGSKVHKNAQSEKFPQPFQFRLYTKEGFNKIYKEAFINDYREITKTYSNAIDTYLKGPKTDNSELRIQKSQADKFYNQFTKEDLKKYALLPAPPVPAEKEDNYPKTKSKSKGGPNLQDIQETYNPSFLEYIIEMENEGASFYLDGEKISAEEAKAIATNNKGKHTDMITQKDDDGNYLVKLSSATKSKIYARSIELKVLNDNSYLIDGIKATKKTFVSVFNKLHQDLTPEVRNNVMNIHVSSAKAISNKEIWFIFNSLQDYGFYRIVAPNQEINRAKGNTPFAIESHLSTQEKATVKEVAGYNAWAKKIQAESKVLSANAKWYPPIDQQDLIKFAEVYKRMSPKQKNQSIEFPFPGIDGKTIEQQIASKKQVAEYNQLAKHCNSQLESEFPIIKVKDVKRIEYLYGIMSVEQKKNAESYPDFSKLPPPPPPAPPAPERATVIEIAEYDVWAKKMNTAIKKAEATRTKIKEYPRIKKEDYDKYYNIYSNLMTEAQRETAEPWPNIPPPPPPKPEKLKEKTVIGYGTKNKSDKTESKNEDNEPKNLDPIIVQGYAKKHPESVTKAMIDGEEVEIVEVPVDEIKYEGKYYSYHKKNKENEYIFHDKYGQVYNEKKIKALNTIVANHLKKPIKFETEDGEIIEVIEGTETEEQKTINVLVNGKKIESVKLKMTKEKFKAIELSTENGNVTNFKLKIPGKPTEYIKDNSIDKNKTVLNNLIITKTGDIIVLFDIKDNQGSDIEPITIEIID